MEAEREGGGMERGKQRREGRGRTREREERERERRGEMEGWTEGC